MAHRAFVILFDFLPHIQGQRGNGDWYFIPHLKTRESTQSLLHFEHSLEQDYKSIQNRID